MPDVSSVLGPEVAVPLLKQGNIYGTPDGRRFRAELDSRQYGPHRSWTLTPVYTSGGMSRDALEQMLFLRRERVFRLDFTTATVVVDTGWTAADLRREV
jgi:hypothetical protein